MGEGGRIIMMGSASSDFTPVAGLSVYALTKGAIASFTHGLARDLGPRGITVNTIQPGPIDTDMNPAAGDTELDASVKEIGYPQPDTRPQRPPDSSECSQPWCR